MSCGSHWSILFLTLLVVQLAGVHLKIALGADPADQSGDVINDQHDDAIDISSLNVQPDDQADKPATPNAKDREYVSPRLSPDGIYLYENFDDEQSFQTNWIHSDDAKYTGKWQVVSGPESPKLDRQLFLPLKARHYAISSKFKQPFKFIDSNDQQTDNKVARPLIVQYEAQFREGLDCGGAYVKLLRHSAINDLKQLTDKTPFTIMFGPDKCGSEAKLHFILQYLNPKTQEYSEKHWKQAKFLTNLMPAFTDKKHHLFKLVLEPNNNFEIFLDDKSAGKGNLLDDLEPAINPPKDIVDPNDTKPIDWDERVQIEDPSATKPEDWDEEAPKTIEDASAEQPSDWLETESKYIPDPTAQKPDDWEDMDGEWEAPLIENPACAKISGCGEWKRPTIPNPAYKGKWRAPKIDNPAYKGKWNPRMIPNPDYFFDANPFASLDAIGALSFELWSMADSVAFDNLIVTSNPDSAIVLQTLTWQDKKAEADASSPSILTRSMHYLKVYPWLWAVVVLAVALPLFLFISYCCDTKRGRRAEEEDSTTTAAQRKKTDASRPDTRAKAKASEEAAAEAAVEESENEDEEDQMDEDEEVDEDEEAADEQDEDEDDIDALDEEDEVVEVQQPAKKAASPASVGGDKSTKAAQVRRRAGKKQ